MYIISVQRTLCHYNAVTLPGDCHARYFCTCVEEKTKHTTRGMNAAVIRTLLHYIKVEPN